MSPGASTKPRRRRPLSTKLLAAYAVVVLGSFALLAVPVHFRLRKDYISRATRAFENALSMRIDEIRVAAEAGDREQLDLLCDRLNTAFQGRVTLLSPEGAVIADSMSARCLERARPDCLPAIRAQQQIALKAYLPLDDTVSVRLHIRLGKVGPAMARLALPIQPVRLQMTQMNRLLVISAIAALSAAGVLSVWLARRIARPVEEMTRIAERIAAGEFDGVLPSPGNDEIGRLAEALGTMQRSLRTMLQDLRAERNQAKGIVDSMADGVIALTPDLTVIDANHAAAALLGLEALEPGQPVSWPIDLSTPLTQALRERQAVTMAFGDVCAGERAISVTMTPLTGTTDRDSGIVMVLRDITDARRAENMGRELVANASHELRTPLAIMAATADTMLAWSDQLPAQHQEFLEIIGRQADRMQQLIRETLELSRLEAGPPDEKMEPINLADIARSVVATLRHTAKAASLSLSTAAGPNEAWIEGIEAQLTGAVTNLVENALRYTPAGGEVSVTVTDHGDDVHLCVTDTGPGIPPAEQQEIFERFVRGRAGDSSRTEGSGLGLAIVRRIAEIHGGRIELASTLGKGSTFRLIIPRHRVV